jgi:hypothetical protein
MDLTKHSPRSVREKMLGIVQLARTIDKAKASAEGTLGEYTYDCPMDHALFDFLGIKQSEFLNAVKNAKNDAEIESYVKTAVAKKSSTDIGEFNKRILTGKPPAGESLEHFTKLRAKVAPDRTDVTTWPELLDLEEGRPVQQHATVVGVA